MSGDASLVVHQSQIADMLKAMTTAHDAIVEQVDDALSKVNAETSAWASYTTSKAAEQDFQGKLKTGVADLAKALEDIRKALADVAESAHDTEVKNVAIIG